MIGLFRANHVELFVLICFVLIHLIIWFGHESNHKKLNGNMSFDTNKLKIHPFGMATQKNLKQVEFYFSSLTAICQKEN